MDLPTREHFRRLVLIGLILMVVGVVDPLEGSLLIVGGSVLIALGAVLSRTSYRLPLIAAGLIAAGVGALFAISSRGGVGGDTGRSVWWLLFCVPYPLGWILGLVAGARALRKQRSEHA